MSKFTTLSEEYRQSIEAELEGSLELLGDSPLRRDIGYVFSMGGKRVRPLLTIFASEAVGAFSQDVMQAAVAIEILHNFTLVHDDIMDKADTRRGKATVHITSGTNTAILVGDQMMALAYDALEKCSGRHLRAGLRIFNEGVKQVCDGQALDENLSKSVGYTMTDYIDMISRKTGALLMAAGELGALLGGGTTQEIGSLGKFGLNIGIAFQILDDMLDLEGDMERFGKPRGLDIMEKKRNFLFIKAQQSMDRKSFAVVDAAYRKNSVSADDVVAVHDAYRNAGIFEDGKKEVADYTERALANLEALTASAGKEMLVELADTLVKRRF